MAKKMGRPLIQIDEAQFAKLCEMQCTAEEIASFFDCSVDTVERWCKRTFDETFADAYKKRAVKGKIALRRFQFKLAEKNTAMAIFLGKNILGQTDKVEQTVMEVEDLSTLAEMLSDTPAPAEGPADE